MTTKLTLSGKLIAKNAYDILSNKMFELLEEGIEVTEIRETEEAIVIGNSEKTYKCIRVYSQNNGAKHIDLYISLKESMTLVMDQNDVECYYGKALPYKIKTTY